jgi:hypothetical protein
MARKQLAALAALILISTPALAFDSLSQPSSGVTFYFSIPLDAQKAKEQVPNFGMLFRGSREYQVVNVDSRMLNNFALGGIEAKWIIAGVVAAGAVVAVASKDKSTSQSYQQQQQQQAATEPPCPATPTCP